MCLCVRRSASGVSIRLDVLSRFYFIKCTANVFFVLLFFISPPHEAYNARFPQNGSHYVLIAMSGGLTAEAYCDLFCRNYCQDRMCENRFMKTKSR